MRTWLLVPALVLAGAAPAPARVAPVARLTQAPAPAPAAAPVVAYREKPYTPPPVVRRRKPARHYPPLITVRQIGTATAGDYAVFEVVQQGLGGSGDWTINYGDDPRTTGVAQMDAGCGRADGSEPYRHTTKHKYRRAGDWVVTVAFRPECNGAYGTPFVGTGRIHVGPPKG